jgi:hypothetical protein
MAAYIPIEIRRQVADRANGYCAYCRCAERLMGVTFEIDHIIPESHGGSTDLENLCLSCPMCNRFKTNRLLVLDPITQELVPLFHPLREEWNTHFQWIDNNCRLLGLSPTGRATIETLRMNRSAIVQLRQYWVTLELHPPV